jgi:threonine dehydrogenase-like Zn-dependent dehydrogenase
LYPRDGYEGIHRLPLSGGPAAYEMFQKKQNGAVKVLLTP